MGWGLLASVAANGLSKTGAGSAQDMSKDNLFLRGLRFDKGKDWWKDSLTGFGWLGGDDSEEASAPPPEFWDNEQYTNQYNSLKSVSDGLLEGNIPDYYKSIGETGGSEFENMLGLTTRDISKSAAESAASQGRGRGGNLAAATAQAVGDASTKARYADYERALQGKQYLLGQGISTSESLVNAALNEQSQYNNFQLGSASQALNRDKFDYNVNAENDAAMGEMIGSLASSAMSNDEGGDGWLGMFTNLFKNKSGTSSSKVSSSGVSSLGSIDNYLNS